ncbi:hypothetical protein [Fervidobacterium sp.]
MKIFGYVLESYGKYVKVKTSDGEYIIKSDKKVPKQGAKIELKDFGSGDYFAKVLAKKPYNFKELPAVKFVQLSEEILEDIEITAKERFIIAIALVLEEISKRRELDKQFLQKVRGLIKRLVTPATNKSTDDEKDFEEFQNYVNVLSGKYGLIINDGAIFIDRENMIFEVFLRDNRFYGIIDTSSTGSAVTLYFEKIPENIEELEKKLKNNFNFVSIKLEAMSDGTYV